MNDPIYVFPYSDEHGAYPGMTLRDYLAAKALQGILTATSNNDSSDNLDVYPKAVAHAAYLIADAMLKERQPKKEE